MVYPFFSTFHLLLSTYNTVVAILFHFAEVWISCSGPEIALSVSVTFLIHCQLVFGQIWVLHSPLCHNSSFGCFLLQIFKLFTSLYLSHAFQPVSVLVHSLMALCVLVLYFWWDLLPLPLPLLLKIPQNCYLCYGLCHALFRCHFFIFFFSSLGLVWACLMWISLVFLTWSSILPCVRLLLLLVPCNVPHIEGR